ncbi:MAG: phage tail tape measure protein [Pseudomonadota bacterium]
MSDIDVAVRMRLVRGNWDRNADHIERDLRDLRRESDRLGKSKGLTKQNREMERLTRGTRKAEAQTRQFHRTQRRVGGGGIASGVATGLAARTAAGGGPTKGKDGRLRGYDGRYLPRDGAGGGATTAVGAAAAARLGMSGPGTIAAGAGAAIGGGILAGGAAIGYSAKQAISFETSMADVKKAVEATDDQIETLGRAILTTSAQTGIAKEELAALTAEAAKSGTAYEDLARVVALSSKAAVGFDMGGAEAGASMAKLRNVFEASIEDLEDLGDTINHIADNSAARERDLVSFLTRTGSNGRLLGMTPQEISAFGAAFLSLGKGAELSATGFNAMVNKLGNAQGQSDAFKKSLKELGWTVESWSEGMETDAAGSITKFLEKLNELEGAQQIRVLSDMFGLEYADDIAAIAGNTDLVIDMLDKVKDAADRAGSLDETFEIFNATTANKLGKAGSALSGFATRIGSEFTEPIGEAADTVGDFFNRLNESLDRAAEAEKMMEKLQGGKNLSAADQTKLANDTELAETVQGGRRRNRQDIEKEIRGIEGALARKSAGGSSRADRRKYSQFLGGDPKARLAELRSMQQELSQVSGTAADLGVKLSALRAQQSNLPATVRKGRKSFKNPALTSVEEQIAAIEAQLKGNLNPQMQRLADQLGTSLGPSADQSMGDYKVNLSAALDQAIAIASQAAQRMLSELSFNASPTITPRFRPAAGAAPAQAGGGKRAVGPTQVNINQTINGSSDPVRTANLTSKKTDRAIRSARSGALHDVGALA